MALKAGRRGLEESGAWICGIGSPMVPSVGSPVGSFVGVSCERFRVVGASGAEARFGVFSPPSCLTVDLELVRTTGIRLFN